MITPTDITQKVHKKYLAFLRALLRDEAFFPLEIPFGKPDATVDYAHLKAWVDQLLAGAKAQLGYGYRVELEQRTMRRYGSQSLPARIVIESELDFLKLINKQREVERVRKNLTLTREQLPQLEAWLAQHPQAMLDHLSVWPELLTVCSWFVQNPRPQRYVRELPIPVHTKFIEEQQPILRALLDHLLPDEAVRRQETRFEQRFYLRYDEPLIRLRLLDPTLQAKLHWPASDLSLPLSQAESLPLAGRRILITENKLNFLSLPPLPDTVAIWGQGFQVNLLHTLGWLHHSPLWYWGDLDVQGLQILAQLRSHFPQTHSLMMDAATLAAFRPFAGSGVATPQQAPPQLTEQERVLYEFLALHQLRLEQERISQGYVVEQVGKIGGVTIQAYRGADSDDADCHGRTH